MRKVNATCYITADQDEQLKLLSARTKVPIAVYIREGIDLALARYATKIPEQQPLFTGERAGA